MIQLAMLGMLLLVGELNAVPSPAPAAGGAASAGPETQSCSICNGLVTDVRALGERQYCESCLIGCATYEAAQDQARADQEAAQARLETAQARADAPYAPAGEAAAAQQFQPPPVQFQLPPVQFQPPPLQFPVLAPAAVHAHEHELEQALSDPPFMTRGGGDVVLESSGGDRTSHQNPPHFATVQQRYQFNLDYFVTDNPFDMWGDVVMHAIAIREYNISPSFNATGMISEEFGLGYHTEEHAHVALMGEHAQTQKDKR